MAKGIDGIPILHLETMNKMVSKMPKAPDTFFTKMFGTDKWDSDTVKWDIEYGSAGMTPFVAPGAPAPSVGVDGYGEGSAKVAFFKEKMFFDEELLNNLRQPGTNSKMRAEKQIARGIQKLSLRVDRRREWMCCQMAVKGELVYTQKGGTKVKVNYGVPEENKITLADNRKWGTGADRNPIEDIYDAKQLYSDNTGKSPEYTLCNSSILKLLMFDSKLQEMLKKSAFGDGDLFKNPATVVGSLIGVGPLHIYDEFYEVPGWLLQNVGTSDTEIFVEDATDFAVGGTLYFWKMDEPLVKEKRTITAVDVVAGKLTIDSAPTRTYKARFDKVWMRRKYVEDDVFHMGSWTKDGASIAEIAEAPYGLKGKYGKFIDRKEEWDPDGLFVRVQDKAFPLLYHPDMVMTIKVK